jgi:hypothetical protein
MLQPALVPPTSSSFMARHPVPAYFAAAFGLSWSSALSVGRTSPPTPRERSEVRRPDDVSGHAPRAQSGGHRSHASYRWAEWPAQIILPHVWCPLSDALALGAAPSSPLDAHGSSFLANLPISGLRAQLLCFGVVFGLPAGLFKEIGWMGLEATWYAVYAAVLWIVVAIVAKTYGRGLGSDRLARRDKSTDNFTNFTRK